METHYILEHRSERNYLEDLLALCDKITEKLRTGGKRNSWRAAKKGLISQVGAFRFMEMKGMQPELASPEDDALKNVDFLSVDQSGNKWAVQSKSVWFAEGPAFLDTPDKFQIWLDREKKKAEKSKRGPDERDYYKKRKILDKVQRDYSHVEIYCDRNPGYKPLMIIITPDSIDQIDGSLKDEYFESFKR